MPFHKQYGIKIGQKNMATRTAPTVNGTPTYKTISVTLYDYTGDQRTDTYQVDADASDVEIEAFVAALQAVTNATIWRVTVGQVYNSTGDSANATEAVWENAKDNVVLLMKTATNDAIDFYIPSPINAMFLEGTENIDPSNVALGALMTAILPFKSAYSFVSARFSHRKQIGKKVNI